MFFLPTAMTKNNDQRTDKSILFHSTLKQKSHSCSIRLKHKTLTDCLFDSNQLRGKVGAPVCDQQELLKMLQKLQIIVFPIIFLA